MVLESIKFKREEDSEWESGYYIGETDNSDNSIILDSNFQPLPIDKDGWNVYDYRTDMSVNSIHIRC